jgi:hypothetical protein
MASDDCLALDSPEFASALDCDVLVAWLKSGKDRCLRISFRQAGGNHVFVTKSQLIAEFVRDFARPLAHASPESIEVEIREVLVDRSGRIREPEIAFSAKVVRKSTPQN